MSAIATFLAQAEPALAAALPGVRIDLEALKARLSSLLADPEDPAELARLPLADLAWADALSRHDAAALAKLEREVLSRVDGATRRIDPSGELADAVRQELRIRLLVGDERPASIASYTGRGPLLHWVLVIATRLALDLKRRRGALEDPEDELEAVLFEDAEHDALRRESRRLLKTWMQEALAALAADRRAVLHLYFVEGVGSEAIGKMFGVHRGTVARWLDEAREQVRSHVRRRALATPGLGPEAIDSLLRAADGYVSLSLSLLAG